MKRDFDHGDMVANILLYRRSATDAQVQAGTGWYPLAGTIVAAIADQTGVPKERVAFALSALSPRNPWRWNVADAYAYASARGEGRLQPTGATTFKRNQARAWQALDTGLDPWKGSALKVRAFVSAIMGDHSVVVVDTWAVRVATGGSKSRVANDREYLAVEAAYRHAAVLLGEEPSIVQAITWLVAQTEGLATMRRGRHDLSFKAGTPEFVKELLS